MQHKKVLIYLEDILESAKAILSHTAEINRYDEFVKNRLVYRAVERELTIIAEAINKIKGEKEQLELLHSHQIVGLRNRLVHDYANTNHEIIWAVVVKHIKPLILETENLINSYEG